MIKNFITDFIFKKPYLINKEIIKPISVNNRTVSTMVSGCVEYKERLYAETRSIYD